MSHIKIQFIHIPKTGGTSLNQVLATRQSWMRQAGIEEDAVKADWGASRPSGRHGHHFAFEFGSANHPDNNFLTFLRNPVDRCYSYMMMAIRSPGNSFWQKIIPAPLKLASIRDEMSEAALAYENMLPHEQSLWARAQDGGAPWTTAMAEYTRAQKKILGTPLIYSVWEEFIEQCFELHNGMCNRLSNIVIPGRSAETDKNKLHPPVQVDERIYESAIQNLDNFYYVGCFEEYDKHVERMFNKMGTHPAHLDPPWWRAPHANKHSYPPMTTELRLKLAELNKYDIMLYEYAKKTFWNKSETR